MKFKFTMEQQGTTVTYESDAIISSELCREFQRFLAGCGYHFTMDQEILIWDHTIGEGELDV